MNTQVESLVIQSSALLAKTWNGHNVRSEPEEGDEGGDAGELVPGRDLRFADIELSDDHFDRLVGQYATRAFFDSGAPDKPRQRLFSSFSRIPLDDKYKNCVALITFGVSNEEVRIEPATIKNLRVKLAKETNKPLLSCTVVGPRPNSIAVLKLEEFAGKPVNIMLSFGPLIQETGQASLPLERPTQTVTPIDRTRILEPGQAEREAETDRQLSQALQGLQEPEEQPSDDAPSDTQPEANAA